MRSASLGFDIGTSRVRCVVADARTGEALGAGDAPLRSGREGILEDPANPLVSRQAPGDYPIAMIAAARAAVDSARAATPNALDIRGVGVAATASTPIPVKRDARALAVDPAFAADLDAQAWLWRDHSAGAEAEEITDALARVGAPALAACGGSYSAEWYWSKILRCARSAPHVSTAAAGWLELCDFATAWLIGASTLEAAPRSVCTAGHKALHVDVAAGGWGAVHTLAPLHPEIARLAATLPAPSPLGAPAGVITPDIADAIGISRNVVVSVGVIDAHAAALGAGVRPGRLVSIVGTSACHMGVAAPGVSVPRLAGVSGVVRGSILPECDGVEAGQAAVGDMFSAAARLVDGASLASLEDEARRLPPGAGGLIALDWVNGVRAPVNDPFVSGAVFGLTLQTRPAQLFRAYVEAAAYGLRAIIDHMARSGLTFTEVVACGGVVARSALAPQIFADVLDRDLDILESIEAGALGAAILAAAASGMHESVAAAQTAMGARPDRRLRPNPDASAAYRSLYLDYACLSEAFGRRGAPLNALMRRLSERRTASSAPAP
jgi:L-ribulokinase